MGIWMAAPWHRRLHKGEGGGRGGSITPPRMMADDNDKGLQGARSDAKREGHPMGDDKRRRQQLQQPLPHPINGTR